MVDYWNDRETWPFVPGGFVFVPDAFEAVGRQLFGSDWVRRGLKADEWGVEQREVVFDTLHVLAQRGWIALATTGDRGIIRYVGDAYWNCEKEKARARFEACCVIFDADYFVKINAHPNTVLYALHNPVAAPMFVHSAGLRRALPGLSIERPEPQQTYDVESVIVANLMKSATRVESPPAGDTQKGATRDAEIKRLAAMFDEQGLSKRGLRSSHIESAWDGKRFGPTPKVPAVQNLMMGKRPGSPGRSS